MLRMGVKLSDTMLGECDRRDWRYLSRVNPSTDVKRPAHFRFINKFESHKKDSRFEVLGCRARPSAVDG